MGAEKPRPLAVRLYGLPSELRGYDCWVAWRYEREDNKWKKKPVNCRTGRDTDAYNPKNWSTIDEALAHLEEHPDRIAGIGFVFDPKEDALAGVDLDKCRDPKTCELAPWAKAIVEKLNTYTEVSPSGTGVKMILRGELPKGHHTTKPKDGGKIEMFTENRYFALTGHHVAGTPNTIKTRHDEFAALYRETFGGKFGIVQPRIEVFDEPGYHDLTDDEIIEQAADAKNGEKFKKLFFDGDISDYDDDHSAADQALADIVAFWCGPNSARVERLFGRSALAREDKWLSREDYRASTSTKAIRRQMEADLFYRPTRCVLASVSTPPPDLHEAALAVARDLAETNARLPQCTVAFNLARRLRKVSGTNPHQFEPAVLEFCTKAERNDAEELWYAFVGVWDVVKYPEGNDVLDLAAKLADEQPYPHVAGRPMYVKLASMAWHLWCLREQGTFFFAPDRTVSLLGCSEMTLVRLKRFLQKEGIIKLVQDYSHPAKEKKESGVPPKDDKAKKKREPAKCQVFTFTGPPP